MIAKMAMAACALFGITTCVHASPFTINAGGLTGADGLVTFTITGDTRSRTAVLHYEEQEQTSDDLNFISTTFDDPNAALARS